MVCWFLQLLADDEPVSGHVALQMPTTHSQSIKCSVNDDTCQKLVFICIIETNGRLIVSDDETCTSMLHSLLPPKVLI